MPRLQLTPKPYAGRIQRTGTDHYFVGLAPQGAFYPKKNDHQHIKKIGDKWPNSKKNL
jgi:hypothetical protein